MREVKRNRSGLWLFYKRAGNKKPFISSEENGSEQGCNGPVTEAIDKIQKHINKQAHDQED